MQKIAITQVKSIIGQTQRQKRTMHALGLRKMQQTVVHDNNPAVQGMVVKVRHLVTTQLK
jgi:large subunit ribosomal protein L30